MRTTFYFWKFASKVPKKEEVYFNEYLVLKITSSILWCSLISPLITALNEEELSRPTKLLFNKSVNYSPLASLNKAVHKMFCCVVVFPTRFWETMVGCSDPLGGPLHIFANLFYCAVEAHSCPNITEPHNCNGRHVPSLLSMQIVILVISKYNVQNHQNTKFIAEKSLIIKCTTGNPV